jgi:hypothetical protein
MAQVFTSYSRRDTETVDTIVGKMSQAGISVWIDREAIKAGNSWRVQIVQAIDTCHAFVLMLSPNSAASDNVRKEIDLSQDSGRTIFAVMLEPTKLPAEIRYQLAGLQFIDVKMLGFDKAVDQLIETVKEHLAKFEPAEAPETRQVELVIQGVDLSAFTVEKKQQLLDFISQLTSADRSQVHLVNLSAGSVHVFVDMPTASAYELKTLALNRDPRFKQLGIASLRLEGDAKYVNVSLGKLTLAATISPLMALWLKIPALLSPLFGATIGKMLTLVLAAVLIAGAGISVSRALAVVLALFPTATQTQTFIPTLTLAPTASQTPTLTASETLPPTPTATQTKTATPTASQTATPSPTPVPTYAILRGEVVNRIACRYGPGDIYLYQFGLIPGNRMEISGRVEVRGRRETETWLWGLPEFFPNECWVNARDVKLDGELSSLEIVYPEKVKLPLTSNWPAPQNVKATRLGDQVNISWDAYVLPLGERESENSPQYLLELWLCQDRQVAFTPLGTFDPLASGDKPEVLGRDELSVIDQAGCVEPSHGWIYLAEKHGYVGPVEIQWPPRVAPTP